MSGRHACYAIVEIELDPPDEEVATVVASDLYDEEGEIAEENGTMMRLVVRPVKELEGRELIMDMHAIMEKTRSKLQKN